MNEEGIADPIAVAGIANDDDHDQVHGRMHAWIDLGFDDLTPDQAALLDHLANLIEAYDRDHARRRLLLNLTGAMSDRVDDLVERTGYEVGESIEVAVSLTHLSLAVVEQGRPVGVGAAGRALALEFAGFPRNNLVA